MELRKVKEKISEKLKSESFINTLDKSIKTVHNILISIYIGRSFGAEMLGVYALLMTASYVCQAIIQGGTDTTVARIIGHGTNVRKTIFSALTIRYLITAIIIALAILVSLMPLEKVHSEWFEKIIEYGSTEKIVIGVCYLLACPLMLHDTVLVASQKTLALLKNTIYCGSAFFAAKLISISYCEGVHYKFLIDAVEIIISWWLLKKNFLNRECKCAERENDNPLAMTGSLLLVSLPYWANSVVLIIYSRIDQIYLAFLMGPKMIGFHAALIQVAGIILIPLGAAINTKLVNYVRLVKANNEKEISKTLRQDIVVLSFLCAAWILGAYLFGGYVMKIVYGSRFNEAIMYLPYYAAVVLPSALGLAFSNWAIAKNKNYLPIIRSMIGATSAVILGWILIPIYELYGAAMMVFFVSFMANVFPYLLIKNFRQAIIGKTRSS